MYNEQIKHNRIKELRDKIEYAENARNFYKNIHTILSQTNSFYLERLRHELEELEKSYKGMDDRNQRKFSRIKIQREVRLNFLSVQYQGVIDDISLSGSFITGEFKQSKGDICRIDLKESVLDSEVAIRAIGSIVRASDSGIAIQFIGMKTESYNWLETELLTQAADPSILEDEIFQRSIFEFDDDLVCSNIFSGSRNKLKKLLDRP